jgi:hypothetical protein
MNSSPSNSQDDSIQDYCIDVNCGDRWQIYRRLQELDIPCECAIYRPLRVEVCDSLAVVQLWSVLRHSTAPINQLVAWLELCWRCPNLRERH